MKPSPKARKAASVTLSKGKQFEFGVPEDEHINIPEDLNLAQQFPLALGTVGEFAVEEIQQAIGERIRQTPLSEVLFSAQVLIATVDAKVAEPIEEIIRLIAAAAFFLADSPGRALAHIKSTSVSKFDDDAFAHTLAKALGNAWIQHESHSDLPTEARLLIRELRQIYVGSSKREHVVRRAETLQRWVYENGDAHQLLIGDLLCAVAIKRASICAWNLLPEYTGLEVERWKEYLRRDESIKDMWPAQRMLGVNQVYAGKSAVVQMPTSAGKTRATELILRAGFVSGRTSLAIVVAPFRALCYEVAQDLRAKFRPDGVRVNQLSDALQQDYLLDLADYLALGIESAPHVVVLTPEKLLYVIRQEPDFLANVGVIVYDEGHQFDDSGRGVTYELLLTSLKRALPSKSQTVLISAVISNAEELASWLLSDGSSVVSDTSVQTSRHVAFTTMQKSSDGWLQFDSTISGEQEFWVPKLITRYQLSEGKAPRFFPTDDSSSVATYLGLKLVPQGGVAVFVGKPESAFKIIRDAVTSIQPRSTEISWPKLTGNSSEIQALVKLYQRHFGKDAVATKGAELGLFAHTGDTPQGIRLALEHSMREGLISFIICTSTLAQGVNLPIRYLLVTSPYQNGKLLKTRDFQNLVGRAGRAGMYGDGTVVFTDFKIYDIERKKKKKWNDIKSLLKPEMSAPTKSALLRLVKPLTNIYGTEELEGITPEDVIDALIEEDETFPRRVAEALSGVSARSYFSEADVSQQIEEKRRTIESIQTFLMAHQDSFAVDGGGAGVTSLAQETFAFHLADEHEGAVLREAFQGVWSDISGRKIQPQALARYGKNLLGLGESLAIDAWVTATLFELQISDNAVEVLDVVWSYIDNSHVTEKLRRLEPAAARKKLVDEWVAGKPFKEIVDAIEEAGGFIRWGSRRRAVTVEAVVGFCQNDLAYQACLLVSAIGASFAAVAGNGIVKVDSHFDQLGKLLKYGLPSESAAAVYEVGFADRVLAQRIATLIADDTVGQDAAKRELRKNSERVGSLLSDYPSYFGAVMSGIVN